MKKYSLFILLLFLGCTYCWANKIDSLKTDKDVLAFAKITFPSKFVSDFDLYWSDDTLYTLDRKILDSLELRTGLIVHWIKTDLNNDGQTDLLIVTNSTLYAILSNNNRYTITTTNYIMKYNRYCNTRILPTVKSIDNTPLILLYHYKTKNSDDFRHPTQYEALECDSIILLCGLFLTYNSNPVFRPIDRVTLDDNGVCEGNCPDIHVSFSLISQQIEYTVSYHEPPFKKYNGIFSKEKTLRAFHMIQYTNFLRFAKEYGQECLMTDQTTASWAITYNDGKIKTLSDYGEFGNASLNTIYHFLVDDLLTENK